MCSNTMKSLQCHRHAMAAPLGRTSAVPLPPRRAAAAQLHCKRWGWPQSAGAANVPNTPRRYSQALRFGVKAADQGETNATVSYADVVAPTRPVGAQQSRSSAGAVGVRGTAAIIGAGPAGVAAAMTLAAEGYRVHVFERRGHPGRAAAAAARTYLIGLGERGLQALDGLGVTVPLRVGRPMRGSVYAYKDGRRVLDPFTPDTRLVGVDRQGLAGFLIDQAAEHWQEAITFHWHCAPAHIDWVARKLQVERLDSGPTDDTGTNRIGGSSGSSSANVVSNTVSNSVCDSWEPPGLLHYDLLVGADGAGSAVRAALERVVPAMKVTQLPSPVAALEYKAFHGLPWCDAIAALLPDYGGASGGGAAAAPAAAPAAAVKAGACGSADPGMTFFAFNNPQPGKPSPGSITLYLNAAGSWSGTLYQPAGTFSAMAAAGSSSAEGGGAAGGVGLQQQQQQQQQPQAATAAVVAAHEAAVRSFTPPGFPEEWVPVMAQQMAAEPPSRISPLQLVSHLAVPSLHVVLLGDAGHSVTPQMGQGCNSALEDAALLGAALRDSGHDLEAALAAFQAKRTPQVHALQHMEQESAWVRRPARLLSDPLSATAARVAWLCFFCLLPLARALPGGRRLVHASLFQNIMSTTLPYDWLHAAIRVAPLIMTALLVLAVALARAVVLRTISFVIGIAGGF